MPSSRFGFAVAAAASVVVACSAAPAERTGSNGAQIIHGVESDASQDAVVLLFNAALGYECSGTLLAPNLVLTARHCVSATGDSGIACDVNGNPLAGGSVAGDFVPGVNYVFVGRTRPSDTKLMGSPDAKAQKFFHDDSKNLCNHDIALVLHDRKIEGARIAQIRLDTDVDKT